MNEKEQLLQLLKTTLQESKDFVLEQAPSVFQEIILWGRTVNTLGAVVCAIGVLTCWTVACVSATMVRTFPGNKYEWVMKDTYFTITIISAVASLLLGIAFWSLTVFGLKAWICPKVYLLEYLGGLM